MIDLEQWIMETKVQIVRKGLKKKNVVERSGVSRAVFDSIMSGRNTNPTIRILQQIERAVQNEV